MKSLCFTPHRLALAALSLTLTLAAPVGLAQTCPSNDDTPTAAESISIRAVGDIVLGTDFPEAHYPSGFEKTTSLRLRKTLGHADVIFGNFEGALTAHNVSTKIAGGSVFAFRMPPAFAPMLKEAGFDVLHIANNHTFDFGDQGFRDTLRHLSQAGILPVGEKDRVVFQDVRGTRLAWIGFNYSFRHNVVGDHDKLAELIQVARRQADLVIISVQAGAEGNEALRVVDHEEIFLGENRRNVFAFARRAVDLGADLVLGHGPHVVRGLECYKGKLIAYSLGNFVGYGALSTRRAAAVSMVLEVSLSRNRHTLGFDVIPVRFSEDKFPEFDESGLVRFLINDLSLRPPLNGSVRLPVPADGAQRYREWLSATGLAKIVGN
jgi:hypothetical protein